MNKTVFFGAASAMALLAGAASAGKLEDIVARGELNCGSNAGLAGFSAPDADGVYQGFDVAFCRAIAAAVLGDPMKVKVVPLSSETRFTALSAGEVDMLARTSTWTYSRDTDLKLDFVGVNYYDGQGFMVPKKLGVKSAKELNGATVCVQPGTTTELNLADYFRANNMTFKPVVIEALQEVNAAFFSGRCDVYTTDASGLASIRKNDAPKGESDNFVILPEIISKEPLGPAVRHGDDQWFDIVKWTIFALVEAEEYGITKANADQMAKDSKNPAILRLLGTTAGNGKAIGLEETWAINAVKAVGNYGEIYERNIVPLGLPRGVNNLWSKGGLMYAPPVR